MESYIRIHFEDLQPITEPDPIIVCQDTSGKELTIDLWCYAFYFFTQIQDMHCTEKSVYLDGIRLDNFIKGINKVEFARKLATFFADSQGIALQEEMLERHNTHVNWCALYALCSYIQEIIESRLCIKLKPSLSETLEEIGSSDNISEIEIKLTNKQSKSITNPRLFSAIISSLKAEDMAACEIDSITCQSNVYTKEYSQIVFVDYLSRFFHDYFKIKRRSNSYISATEQRIICYFLYKLGFSNYPVQESRFRQLFSNRHRITTQLLDISPILRLMDPKIDISFNIPVSIVTYNDWKDGKLNPLHSKTHAKHANLITQISFPNFEKTSGIVKQLFNLYDNLYSQ